MNEFQAIFHGLLVSIIFALFYVWQIFLTKTDFKTLFKYWNVGYVLNNLRFSFKISLVNVSEIEKVKSNYSHVFYKYISYILSGVILYLIFLNEPISTYVFPLYLLLQGLVFLLSIKNNGRDLKKGYEKVCILILAYIFLYFQESPGILFSLGLLLIYLGPPGQSIKENPSPVISNMTLVYYSMIMALLLSGLGASSGALTKTFIVLFISIGSHLYSNIEIQIEKISNDYHLVKLFFGLLFLNYVRGLIL